MDLKELLGEDLYNQVVAKAGDKKLAVVNDGSWFPKEKFDEVNEARKRAEADLTERDKQLTDLKKAAEGNESLQAQIKELEDANKAAMDQYNEYRTKTALKMAVANDVHDPDLFVGLIDQSKVEFAEDGTIKSGLDDQIKALRESKAFLFKPQEDNNPQFSGFKPFVGGGGDNGDKGSNIGKQLAAQKKQSSENAAKSQEIYFKNGG